MKGFLWIRACFWAALLSVALFVALFVTQPLFADDLYQVSLIEKANQEAIHADPTWHALLHYKPNIGPGYTSLIDEPAFFISDNGKTNPKAELDATIKSFFSTATIYRGKQPARCVFTARFEWLSKKLQIDPRQLPPIKCPLFDEWFSALDPVGMTLIFPEAFLNNPASAFGHTLFRIDASTQNNDTRLLAYAATYAAATNKENAFLYALKGLFGGYKGFFTVLPYYKKVNQYSAIESRDIWEYQLNLSAPEVRFLVKHIWELLYVNFDYYYFDENCSYHLLSLLEVVRPDLKLTNKFFLWTIPVDTVRAITDQPGLVGAVNFRPSPNTILSSRLKNLSHKEQSAAKNLVDANTDINKDSLKDFSGKSRAEILDLAYDYLIYKRSSGRVTEANADQRAYQILQTRSKIAGVPSTKPPIIQPTRPDQGHKTRKLSLKAGQRDHDSFYDIAFRAAYHDVLDSAAGFRSGSEIEMFAVDLRANDTDQIALERFSPISILSLSPRNEFVQPTSYKINTEISRQEFKDGRKLITKVNGGPGRTWSLSEGNLIYFLAESSLEYSSHYDHNYAIGLGPNLGLILDITDGWRLNPSIYSTYYLLGDEHNTEGMALEQRITVTNQSAIRAQVLREKTFSEYSTEYWLGLDLYF